MIISGKNKVDDILEKSSNDDDGSSQAKLESLSENAIEGDFVDI